MDFINFLRFILLVILCIISYVSKKTEIQKFIDINKPITYFSKGLREKLLFMRTGETYFNADTNFEESKINKEYIDSRLNNNGVNQSITIQQTLNSLPIEKVYASPFYRTLQTLTYSLENHPNKDNLIAIVHPMASEVINCVNDYILDIKQTKKDFNMNSKVKVDWSLFDNYVKKIKYDENFYYFDFFDAFEKSEKKEMYQNLKNLYDNGNVNDYKKVLSNLAKLRFQREKRLESLKHAQKRFYNFVDYVKKDNKNTLYNKTSKILVVSHAFFMKIGTDSLPYEEKTQDFYNNCYDPFNCEILCYDLTPKY